MSHLKKIFNIPGNEITGEHHSCFCPVWVINVFLLYSNSIPLFLSNVPPLDADSPSCGLTCCDSHQLSLLLLDRSAAVTSAIFCHQFAQAATVKWKSLLIWTALAYWIPLPGLICAPTVVFSHSYSQEITFRLMKFVGEQLSSATSNLADGEGRFAGCSRLARNWHAQCFCISSASSCPSSSSSSSS